MYGFLHMLLSDRKGGEIFSLFGAWHFFYLGLAVFTAAIVMLILRKRGDTARQRVVKAFLDLAFCLYLADFFLMPLAYGEIDIEKLPFHVCTAMCVACFLSYRIGFLKNFRLSFVKLGFLSNLIYLVYPAGVMWHAVHPLSYRVIQTLLFHCVMTVFGFLTLVYEHREQEPKFWLRDLAVIAGMVLWAVFGNLVYNGTAGTYSHFFNWFFVVRDPFSALPEAISPFVMPLLNIALFFTVEMLLNLLLRRVKRKR